MSRLIFLKKQHHYNIVVGGDTFALKASLVFWRSAALDDDEDNDVVEVVIEGGVRGPLLCVVSAAAIRGELFSLRNGIRII